MKAATGEMNLTIITIIAIGAILAFFWLLWPTIQSNISDGWADTQTTGYVETYYNDFV